MFSGTKLINYPETCILFYKNFEENIQKYTTLAQFYANYW